MFLLFFFLSKRQKKNSSNFQWFAVFFWNKELLFLYFYKTADQFVCSCLKQKHFNKKKHQQYLHLTFLLAFPKCKKKTFSFVWLETKKRTQKAKNNAFGQRVRKRRQRFKSLSSRACWQEKKVFFFSRVHSFFFSEISFLKQKQDCRKKEA